MAGAQAELGIIPRDAADDIERAAVPEKVTLERTMEIEKRTRHDVAALYEAIAEKCTGEGARWVHFGLTSNDIKDTALALQLKDGFAVLLPELGRLCDTLARLAKENESLLAVGRSHGQHAVPITYGLRFAVWLDALCRHLERLGDARTRACVGKIAGATGSHAAMGIEGLDVQRRVLNTLGLGVPNATTQIVQRDRHAEVVMALANLAATLDKMATDLRNLQRTEIGETFEPFAAGQQVGSSAMPHKRNPITCEKISGIARIIRSLVAPALENVVSWEERDISHSSAERFILPQAFILTDYIVRETNRVLSGLTIDEKAVVRNLETSRNRTLSEYIVTTLTRGGMDRPVAHKRVRELVQTRAKSGNLVEAVISDPDLAPYLDEGFGKEYYESICEVSRRIVGDTISRFGQIRTSGDTAESRQL